MTLKKAGVRLFISTLFTEAKESIDRILKALFDMAGCLFSFQIRLFLAWAALGTWLDYIVTANQGSKTN